MKLTLLTLLPRHANNLIAPLFITFLSLPFVQCSTENERITETSSSLSISLSGLLPDGELMTLPADGYLELSIEASNGEVVFENYTLAYNQGQSENLMLEEGTYKITTLIVRNKEQQLVAVVPQTSSLLGDKVATSLPLSFSTTEGVVRLDAEALDHRGFVAADFGYATFGTLASTPQFSIAVLTNNEITNAKAIIKQHDKIIHAQEISAEESVLSFDGDDANSFVLEIFKDGYTTFSKEFQLADLKKSLGDKNMEIELMPALTFEAIGKDNFFIFDLHGKAGSTLHIDWGDNTKSVVVLPLDNPLQHTYTANRNSHHVNVTGELANITLLSFYYEQGAIRNVSTTRLLGLEDLRIGFTTSPEILDISQNSNLKFLDVAASSVKSIRFPQDLALKGLSLTPEHFSSSELEKIVTTVYQHASSANVIHGELDFVHTTLKNKNNTLAVSVRSKLTQLHNELAWEVDGE